MALDGEVGQGAKLAGKYGVRAYPNLLFVDGEGNLVAQSAGYRKPSNFIKLGMSVVEQRSGN